MILRRREYVPWTGIGGHHSILLTNRRGVLRRDVYTLCATKNSTPIISYMDLNFNG